MVRSYASDTTISAERTRMDIERLLIRYGADGFYYGSDRDVAIIGFRMRSRMFKFRLTFPPRTDYQRSPTGLSRSDRTIQTAWDQAKRSRWRALYLIIRAKLEAVEIGIVEFEDEFMPQTVMPDGATVAEWMQPQLVRAYETGIMPADSMLAIAAPERRSTR